MTNPNQRPQYYSGEDYVLVYGEIEYTFSENDFKERCEQAAKKLGIITERLDDAELSDLVKFAVNDYVDDPHTELGIHLNKLENDPRRHTLQAEGLVRKIEVLPTRWLRRLVFRQAWIDQGIKIDEIGIRFDETLQDLIYVGPDSQPIAETPSPMFIPYENEEM